MRRPPGGWAGALAALAWLAGPGCAPAPVDQLRDPAAVLRLPGERLERGGLRSLHATGRLWVARHGRSRALRVDLTAARPGRLRVTAWEGDGDLPVAALGSDGTGFVAWERASGRCYTGRPCRENLARLLALAVNGVELVDLLFGAPPAVVAGASVVSWDERRASYRVDVTAQERTQATWITHGSGLSRMTQLKRDGRVEAELRYGRVRQVEGRSLPTSLQLDAPLRGLEVTLRYREVALDGADVAAPGFALSCPSWAQVEALRCDGEE